METNIDKQKVIGRARHKTLLSTSTFKVRCLFFIRICLITACLLPTALLSSNQLLAQEIVLISNTDTPVSTLSRDEIKRIFLGKQRTLRDGKVKISFAIQQKTEASRLFLKEYVQKNAYQYSIYWKKRVFAGKGKAPQSFTSDQEVVAFVSETPGAVGYVSMGTDIGDTKIVQVQ